MIGVLLLAAALVACGAREQPKRYPMQGEVKALDGNAKTATIAAGQIADWMGPMTMEYKVKPDSEFEKLHVGDRIEATVVVNDLAYYVTDVKIVGKS
jgi:Cu/Ag efflux protein CusF